MGLPTHSEVGHRPPDREIRIGPVASVIFAPIQEPSWARASGHSGILSSSPSRRRPCSYLYRTFQFQNMVHTKGHAAQSRTSDIDRLLLLGCSLASLSGLCSPSVSAR